MPTTLGACRCCCCSGAGTDPGLVPTTLTLTVGGTGGVSGSGTLTFVTDTGLDGCGVFFVGHKRGWVGTFTLSGCAGGGHDSTFVLICCGGNGWVLHVLASPNTDAYSCHGSVELGATCDPFFATTHEPNGFGGQPDDFSCCKDADLTFTVTE